MEISNPHNHNQHGKLQQPSPMLHLYSIRVQEHHTWIRGKCIQNSQRRKNQQH